MIILVVSLIIGIALMQLSRKIKNEELNHIVWFCGLFIPMLVGAKVFVMTDIQESIFGIVTILMIPLINYMTGYLLDRLRGDK